MLRGFLLKPDIDFCGIPAALMIPKQVEDYFPPINTMLEDMNIQKLYPPSGFASGIVAVKNWESIMKIPLIPDEGLNNLTLWNPRTPVYYCKAHNCDNYTIWRNRISNISIPDEEYARQSGSSEFKFAQDYSLYKPLWERK